MTRNEIGSPRDERRPVMPDGLARRDAPAGRSEAPVEVPVNAPSRTRRIGSALVTLLVLLLIGGGVVLAYLLLVPRGERQAPKSGGAPPQTVGVATIKRGDVAVEIQALGTVTPLANVTVKTQISGQLIQVGFKEGQLVKAGDFLAQIDPRPYEALLHQYQGQLAHDQGLLAEAIVDNQRYQTLLNQTSIARQTAEDQKYVVEQDQGTVKADQGLIEAQKVNLAFCHITAPVSGRVGLRQVDPGNYAQTSDTNGIVIITQLQPISVIFSMPETVIEQVVQAQRELAEQDNSQKGDARLASAAFDQANLKQVAMGRLETLDNTIDTTTGQVKARATFDNADGHLFPNAFVNIHLKVGELHDAVVAPQAAVQRGSIGTFAYLVGADGKVTIRKIVLGPSEGDTVAITQGLQPGDRVVIDGTDRLREGSAVKVAGAPAGDGGKGSSEGSRKGAHREGKDGAATDGGHGGQP